MYQPTTRLLTILELLQARSQLSAAEMAERLEVDTRSVRRYITMLQDLGIPVETVRGRHGGYRLRPGFKLPPLMFTGDEALAVSLGLMASRWLGLTTEAPATEGALAKLERVLPMALRERVAALQDAVGFSGRDVSAAASASGDLLLSLSAAVRRQVTVRIGYESADGRASERDIDPYGLVFHFGRWYLIGRDHRSGEVRTFRADRVQACELLEAAFQRPPGFDAVRALERSLANIPWGTEMRVLLKLSLAEARARIPAYIAEPEETPDGVLFSVQTSNLRDAAISLVNLNCDFTVLHPPALREELASLAASLGQIAARTGAEA